MTDTAANTRSSTTPPDSSRTAAHHADLIIGYGPPTYLEAGRRWLVISLLLLLLLKVLACGLHIVWSLPQPVDIFHLESKFLYWCQRAETPTNLYPEWQNFPHAANFFGPIYFLTIRSLVPVADPNSGSSRFREMQAFRYLARLLNVLIALTVASLVYYQLHRLGMIPALFGLLFSLGVTPLKYFVLVARPDLLADGLGFAAVCCWFGSGVWGLWGGSGLLLLALLTKQSAAVWGVAGLLGLVCTGRYRRAALAAVWSFVLTVVGLSVCGYFWGPGFFHAFVAELDTDTSAVQMMQLTRTVAFHETLLYLLPVLGWCWLRLPGTPEISQQNGWAWWWSSLVVALGCTLAAAKLGADLNYFLPLRLTASVGFGYYIFQLLQLPTRRWQGITLDLLGLLLLCCLSISLLSWVYFLFGQQQMYQQLAQPPGQTMIQQKRELCQWLIQQPNVCLSNQCFLNSHLGAEAPFVDPWLFRRLALENRLQLQVLKERLAKGYYPYLLLNGNLFAAEYGSQSFDLPPELVTIARQRYQFDSIRSDLYCYRVIPIPTNSPQTVVPE